MRRALLLILALLLTSGVALGQDKTVTQRLGDMLSPGQLSKSHSYIETTSGCLECHSLNKGVSDLLCLDCHREIKDRLDQKLGFHGLNKDKSCLTCHNEHKGRDNRTFDTDLVKHDKLKLPLTGAHQPLKCTKCHTSKFQSQLHKGLTIDGRKKKAESFLGLQSSCDACHGKAHGTQFKKRICTDCHVDQSWRLTKFDHEKQSEFKLRGKHKKLTCKACHSKDKKHPKFAPFQGIGHQCSACHNDPHKGRSGKECNSCHFPDSWKKFLDKKQIRGFNHDKTKFKLIGKHRKVGCEECHKDRSHKDFKRRGFDNCTDCHKDPHRGQFKQKTCESCHNLKNSFKKGFNHDKTKFPLKALHGEQKCKECHGKGQYVLGEQGTCEGCHHEVRSVMEGRWLNADHKPIGPDPMFRTVNCGTCHKTTESKVHYDKVRKACVKCHNEHFGDLWDYREKKYGPRKNGLSDSAKQKRLRQTHRFGDFVSEEK